MESERKIGYSLHKGTETLVRDRERFEIEGVRDRESQLYFQISPLMQYFINHLSLAFLSFFSYLLTNCTIALLT